MNTVSSLTSITNKIFVLSDCIKRDMNLVPQFRSTPATQAISTVNTAREDELIPSESNDTEEDLQSILNGFINHNSCSQEYKVPRYVVPDYEKHIKPGKCATKEEFNNKLKHFFIFSVSGKPIYTLNGNDELIIGYSGLITTIISSFQHQLGEKIKCIDFNDTKITILEQDPIVLVSITRIGYEMAVDQNKNQHRLLVNQLELLYNYLVSIISKPSIGKYFENRMNYDLRKVLTPLDFKNLDDIGMKSTYGVSAGDASEEGGKEEGDTGEEGVGEGETNIEIEINDVPIETIDLPQQINPKLEPGFEYYISQLLNNSLPIFRLSYTIRSKLCNILYNERIDDLLFGVLSYDLRHILGLIKPKTHGLSNEDLKVMLRIINNNNSNIKNIEQEDLWLPICLPEFNSNGFLYCYVKTFDLATLLTLDGKYYTQPKLINIILLSTNKNNFFKFKQCSTKIIDSIIEQDFKEKLYKELNSFQVTPRGIAPNGSGIIHFIYKDKARNLFLMSKSLFKDRNAVFQYVYYYTNLYNCKSSTIQNLTGDNSDKKLSFIRYDNISGVMISDDKYEFYCLGNTELTDLIKQGLEIIRWCGKNEKRLFNHIVRFSF